MPTITSDGIFQKPIRLTVKDFLDMTLDERIEYCKNLALQFATPDKRSKKSKDGGAVKEAPPPLNLDDGF